jgi:adenylate kinase
MIGSDDLRVLITGVPGSGKSWLGGRLGAIDADKYGKVVSGRWHIELPSIVGDPLVAFSDNLYKVVRAFRPEVIVIVERDEALIRATFAERGSDQNNNFADHFRALSSDDNLFNEWYAKARETIRRAVPKHITTVRYVNNG